MTEHECPHCCGTGRAFLFFECHQCEGRGTLEGKPLPMDEIRQRFAEAMSLSSRRASAAAPAAAAHALASSGTATKGRPAIRQERRSGRDRRVRRVPYRGVDRRVLSDRRAGQRRMSQP
jgi:hypothetical protein